LNEEILTVQANQQLDADQSPARLAPREGDAECILVLSLIGGNGE
jgi:hypothetical protein